MSLTMTNSVLQSHLFFLALTLIKFKLLRIYSIKLKAAHLVCLFSHFFSLSLLPYLSVMLLDTTESTSELGWTTYPDTGVSRELAVNVLSSCWSVNTATLGVQSNVLHTCYTFIELCDLTLMRD